MSKTNKLLTDISQQVIDSGLSIPELARKAKVSPNSLRGMRPVSKWTPTAKTLRAIEGALARLAKANG